MDANLHIPTTIGGPFTWQGTRRGGLILKRLDYFLCNAGWLETFPDGTVEIMPRTASDHAPILFRVAPRRRLGAKPFRFIDAWLKHPDIDDLVQRSWNVPIAATGIYRLIGKLARLKVLLKRWNKDSFGDLFRNKDLAEQNVRDAEAALAANACQENVDRLASANSLLLNRLETEEDFWKQKAGLRWIKEGDANTSFFHASVKMKRHSLGIQKLKNPDGSWSVGDEELAGLLTNHFQNLFRDNGYCSSDAEGILCHSPISVSENQNDDLLRPADELELRRVLSTMHESSAPGPDGYSVKFFKKFWTLLAQDMVDAANDFLIGTTIPKALGAAWICLIPKTTAATAPADYRPITLCNVNCKILTKLLSSRLSTLLPSIISVEQSAFIKGRNITDNILMVEEMLSRLNKRRKFSNVILKLDFKAAFDKLGWSFLLAALRARGFSEKFCDLVLNVLDATWLSVLINGFPKGFFKPSRGVRQGDPLSPALFIIALDALSRCLTAAVASRSIQAYVTPKLSRPITHLAFADDVIIFTTANRASLKQLSTLLQTFLNASSLELNRSKSSVIHARSPSAGARRRTQNILGFHHAKLLSFILAAGWMLEDLKPTIFNRCWTKSNLVSLPGRTSFSQWVVRRC
ncbi:hypothetical protein HPP92_023811 [Vanilla planifolia]|uniref:Reverse transcriptase domain-containing protein n=1 Tax=Vanilla planifolia TaxID=51239 RepID=A0A835PJR2_VANPL|nr:hypothetical protein HPP92_023811 [Vanilla planifolia]